MRRYVAQCRQEGQRRAGYLPLACDPGADAPVDWGEGVASIAGERAAVQLFVMRLCDSRRTVSRAWPAPRQDACFDGHVRAFQHVQGVPRRLTYDHVKTAVQRSLAGHTRQAQPAFSILRRHSLFESDLCTPGEGHEKGRVEPSVGVDRRTCMVPIPPVASLEVLNAHWRAPCLAEDRRQVTGPATPSGEAWRREQPSLRPRPTRDVDCCVTRPATLTPDSQVIFETNRASVPADSPYAQVVSQA